MKPLSLQTAVRGFFFFMRRISSNSFVTTGLPISLEQAMTPNESSVLELLEALRVVQTRIERNVDEVNRRLAIVEAGNALIIQRLSR
jgi:hypothetical protein